ncbi:AN1-type zinc finger protein 4-like [Lampetra planeri]
MDKREPPYYNSEESPYVSYRFPFYETMEVLIETLTGTFFEIRVSPFESVMSVKAKIQRLEGIPIAQQHLIWRNIELEDDYCLHDYHITHGCTIKLVLAMRGGPINTRKVAVEDPAVREMADYMEENREEILDKLPANKQVTLLVFREGDQLNFFRVLERGDGTLTPLSESLSGGSMYNLYAEEEEEDAEESPSVEQLQENALTMTRMNVLRNNMSFAKKPKKGIPKLQPRPPSPEDLYEDITTRYSRHRLRAFPQCEEPHLLPPLHDSNAESSQQPPASPYLPGSPVTTAPLRGSSRTGPPPPTLPPVPLINPLSFCPRYAGGRISAAPVGLPYVSTSLLTTGVIAGSFHPAVGQMSGGQGAHAPMTDHQKATITKSHAEFMSSFSPLPAIPNLFDGRNFAANALTGEAYDAIVRSEGLRDATGGSLSMGADVLEGVAVPGRGEAGAAGGAPAVPPSEGTLGSTHEDLASGTHLLMHEAGGSLFNNSHVAGSYALSAADIWPAYSLFPQLDVGGALPGLGPSAFCIPPSGEKDAAAVNADAAPECLVATEDLSELADEMDSLNISTAAVAATAARAAERRESVYKAEVAKTVQALERLMIPKEGSDLDNARLDTKWELIAGAQSGSRATHCPSRQLKGGRVGSGDDDLPESTKTLKRLKRSAGEPPRAAKSGAARTAPFAGGRGAPPVPLLKPLLVPSPRRRAARLPPDGLGPPSSLGASNLRPPAQVKRFQLPLPMCPGAFQQNFGGAGNPSRVVSAGKKVVGAHARPRSGSEGDYAAAAGAVPSCGGSSSNSRDMRLLGRMTSRDRHLPHGSSVARAATPDLLHRCGAETTTKASVSSYPFGAASYSLNGARCSEPCSPHAEESGDEMYAVKTWYPRKKAATKRCSFCGRKTGLATSYECRCGNNFCGMHRYAEVHACTFDYKSTGRRLLLDSHPAISAPKLPKI